MIKLQDKLCAATSLVARGKVSRRDFVQLAIASGLTASVGNLMFARAVRSQAKRGGVLKVGIAQGATTDSMDPGLYNDNYTGTALWGTLSNSLTEIAANGDVVPDLAQSFESANAAKRWVFKLRRDSTFHNGKSVTADDVVASILHHRGADSKSAARSLLQPITSLKSDGPETIIFELAEGNADFPYILSDYHLPIMPANPNGSADWQSGIRTGAYSLVKFDPGVNTTFVRNPNYFKSDRGWFDAVECLSIRDVTARTNAMTSGEIQYMHRADVKTLELLKQNPEVKISEVTGYGHYIYVMNVTLAPFDNSDVRNAIKHSVDRNLIFKQVFLNHGTIGNDNPIAPKVKFSVNPDPVHTYDPEQARSLLKKAGLSSLSFDLSVAEGAFTGATDAALLWKEAAKACNIDINVVREPEDAYWDNVWRKKPFVASYWSGRPTCDWMFTTAYAGDSTWNDTFWKNARFDELLVAARGETDDAKRAAMYAEMQQLVHDDGGVVNILFNSFIDAHASSLAHGELAANYAMDGAKVAERWWFA